MSLSQNTRLMTTPSKGTDTAKMLPLEGRTLDVSTPTKAPWAHGGRKTVARYAEDAEFLPGIRLGSMIVPEGSHTPSCTRSES